jgi:ribonuclease HI
LIAELSGVMMAIEIASENNWQNLWIEVDSSPVVLAFKTFSTIPLSKSQLFVQVI